MRAKSVVLRPVDDGPLIVLANETSFVSDESGQLHRCAHLREALERAGWVYVNAITRH
jgi:hypothetical protein